MKRDMDLIRLILLEIENKEDSELSINLTVDGYSKEQVAYHCRLLYDHGFIDDYSAEYGDDELQVFAIGELTWDGYEYLDTVREKKIWEKFKTIMKEKAIPMTLTFVIKTAEDYVSKQLGL